MGGAAAHANTTSNIAPKWQLDAPAPSVTFQSALAAYNDGRYEEALASAKLAGAKGDTDAQVLAGTILMNGEASLINDNEAVDWFSRAAAGNNSDAHLALGKMSMTSRGGLSPQDALIYFTQASKAGRIEANRAIGEMYMKGVGVVQDSAKAQVWLKKAAKAGNTDGARKMGDTLIESDPQAALEWYEKAAANGDDEAAYIAAIMYVENYEIRPNSARAAELLRQAANAGIAGAQADYGLLVYQGAGVPQSTEDAAIWFEKSARGGDREGQFLFAFTLAKGEGVTQSYEDAYYWILRSEKAGASGASDYDEDRQVLKQRLDDNVDSAILDKARARFKAER